MAASSVRVERVYTGQDAEGNRTSSPFIVFMNVTNTLTHLCLGAVILSAVFVANQYSFTTHFKQHIYICVIGYILLMGQAVLSFNPHTSWTQTLKYNEKRVVHWMMQIVGSILAIVGSAIRITNIQSHFQSLHGIFGIIALVLTILSLIGGVVNLYSMKLKINPILVKMMHSCLGSLTLIAAFLCLIFGFNHNVYRLSPLGDINANVSISLTTFALAGTLTSAIVSGIKRVIGS